MNLFDKKFTSPVGKMGLAWKVLCAHGVTELDFGAGSDAGEEGAGVLLGGVRKGFKVSGKVARLAAAGSVGRYRPPGWPQALSPTALAARVITLIRI